MQKIPCPRAIRIRFADLIPMPVKNITSSEDDVHEESIAYAQRTRNRLLKVIYDKQ